MPGMRREASCRSRDSRGGVTEVPGVLAGGRHATLALATAATGRQRWGAQDFNKVTEAVSGRILSFQQTEPQPDWWAVLCRGRPGAGPTPPTVSLDHRPALSQRLNRPPCERAYRWKSSADPGLGRDLLRNSPQKQSGKKNELDLTKTFKTMLFKKILLRGKGRAPDWRQLAEVFVSERK